MAHVEELEGQRRDLESAMAELEGLIRETDRRIRESFEQTFEAAAKNFEDVVQHLFPGGRGRLRLVQAEQGPRPVIAGEEAPNAPEPDPDEEEQQREAGVEIEVTPPGKSTKRLSLLSGGEKSLVALAFMFAVFLARPCPFYILDEVEAALDDINIDRFLELVRRYSDRAQFIVVTHQKRTMDAADTLYGVSMGGDGISRVISRRLEGRRGRRRGSLSCPRDTHLARAVRPRRRRAAASPGAGEEEPERRGFFRRLRENMSKTREALGAELQATVFQSLDDEAFEHLEETLIYADVGAPTTAAIVERLEREAAVGRAEPAARTCRAACGSCWPTPPGSTGTRSSSRSSPTVILVVGVNGSGKTTTIGKMAWHLQRELGRSVLLAAADTFRAAAAEQLTLWAERAGCEIVRGEPGSDPGAVAFDAIQAARARGHDVVIIDTAGPPPHPAAPDGGAEQGPQGDRPAGAGRPARDAAHDRRHHRPERAAPGAPVP